ncbi:MAG: hypothetical protein LAT55_08890 [Opitutales bacterium]|nr:hypothetical protein [Opitutales bacterium]
MEHPNANNAIIDFNAQLPEGYLPTADQVLVKVEGTPLRVVRYSQCDVPFCFVHASLPENEEHEVALSIKRHHEEIRVYPSRLGIQVRPPEKKQPATFRIHGNPYLVVETDGLGYLLLAFEPPAPDPHGPGVIAGPELGVHHDPKRVQTREIQDAMDRVSADPDLHTLMLPSGWYRAGNLSLRSNCRLHLCRGAVLQASDRADDIGDPAHGGWHHRRAAFINALSGQNISLTGPGHIDGNRSVLDNQGYYRDMVSVKGCHNLRIDGPVFSGSCNWNTHLRGCEEVEINRLKVLNNRPLVGHVNTDGVNPDCCRRVTIHHCLMHTGDDAVAVKSCGTEDGWLGDVADITVTDLIAINNSATAKIGTETCAARMERIRFERIDAVRTARLCVIDGFDRATISEVTFRDVQLNQFDRSRPGSGSDGRLIDLHASAPTWRKIQGRSRIENVKLQNITADERGQCRMAGLNEDFGVSKVQLENITVAGKPLTLEEIERNDFVHEVTLENPT